MMEPRQEAQGALFYEFSIEDHVPGDQNRQRAQEETMKTLIGTLNQP